MFKKIPLFLSDLQVEKLSEHVYSPASYGPTFNIFGIQNYYKEYINLLIKDKIKFNIPPNNVGMVRISDHGVSPHIDHHGAGLNYYIRTPPATTLFWEPENQADHGTSKFLDMPDGTQKPFGAIDYSTTPLKQIGSFQARSHEAWLLDVSRIHSVEKPYLNVDRVYIRWNWMNNPYAEILESIEILSQP